MALLDLIQNVSNELGLPAVTQVVGSSDNTVRQLVAMTLRSIREARARFEWPALRKIGTFTLATGVAKYALPSDIDRQVMRTIWNNTTKWELIGPSSPQDFEWRTRGLVVSGPRQRFRPIGWANSTIEISPTPGAGENGQIISFEYQSTTAIAPRTWVTGATFLAGSYCSYDGQIYKTTLGGVTGATPPTHTGTTPVSDGGVSWTYYSLPYSTFMADTDRVLIDEDVIGFAVQWRWLAKNNLEYAAIEREYKAAIMREIVAEGGAQTINLAGPRAPRLIGPWNIPDTGWGN